MKTWRLLTSYCHEQNRLDLEKINLIYCRLKLIWVVRKRNIKITPFYFPFPIQLQSFTPTSLYLAPNSLGVDGAGYVQYLQISLCCAIFLTLFPRSSMMLSKGCSVAAISFSSQSPPLQPPLTEPGHGHLIHRYKSVNLSTVGLKTAMDSAWPG